MAGVEIADYLALNVEAVHFIRLKNVFLGLEISDGVEEDVEASREKSPVGRRPGHGVRLSASSYAVGEEKPVSAAQQVVDERKSHDAEQRGLTEVLVENAFERVFDVFAAKMKQ